MEIRVFINDNDEWFDNFDDAIYYLGNARNDYENESEETENIENAEYESYPFKENYDVQKISLSTKDDFNKGRVKNFLNNGYEITYEGKTGVTLEKIKDVL